MLAEPAPVIQTSRLGEVAIVIAVKPWVAVRSYEAAIGEIHPAIVQEFRAQGLAQPPPALLRVDAT